MSKIKQAFTCDAKAVMPFWLTSLFFALAIVYPVLVIAFELKPQVTDFSQHIISNAALQGLDISKRVSLFYKILLGFPVLAALFFAVINTLTNKGTKASSQILSALSSISLIGIACIMCGLLLVNIDICITVLLLFCTFIIVEIRFSRFGQNAGLSLWPVFISIVPSLMAYIYFRKNYLQAAQPPIMIDEVVVPVNNAFLFFPAFLLFSAIIVYFLPFRIFRNDGANTNNKTQAFIFASLPLMGAPAIVSLALELLNVLNIRFGFNYTKPMLVFAITFVAALITGIYLYKKFGSKTFTYNVFEKYFLPVALVSLAMIMTQPWKMMTPPEEFYEMANSGLAVDHFFRYGSIPIIENFDAHMLNNQFTAYLYGFLNGYEPWAPFLYQSYITVLEMLVVFYIFKKPLGAFAAFIAVVFLPVIHLVLNEYALSGLLILFTLRLLENKSKRNFYIFWSLSIFLCLFKLDIGFAGVLAALGVYTLLDYGKTGKIQLKNLIITGAVSGIIMLMLFMALCLLKGINPITRLQEFLLAAMSNQNWAVVRMGNMSSFLFRIFYNILPALGVACAALLCFRIIYNKDFRHDVFKKPHLLAAFGFFLYFFLFFMFNIPRGIVRHNFEYGNLIRITSTLPVALLMATLLLKKWRLPVFLTIFFTLYLVLNANLQDFKNRNYSFFNLAVNSLPFHEQFSETGKFPGTRVRATFAHAESFKKLLNALLTKNETYYDFSSYNYYHALTGRKNPSYVNQTPLLLNGDIAQNIEIERLKKANVPLILMPIKGNMWHAVDEVYVDYKYYKLSEYIYGNYMPLLRLGSFDIYVQKNKKSEFRKKINNLGFAGSGFVATDLSFMISDKLNSDNLTLHKNENNQIDIKATGPTPYFMGLIQLLKTQPGFVSPPHGKPADLEFDIQSAQSGTVKIYYNTTPTDTYTEERVKEFNLAAGENKITLSLPSLPHDVMIGINTPQITLKRIALKGENSAGVERPEKTDYWLGDVARLWAEASGEGVFESIKAKGEPLTKNSASLLKPKPVPGEGFYAVVELQSLNDINCHIDIVEKNETLATYSFAVKKGRHKYAVRISSNFYWWNAGPGTTINFLSPEPIEIHNFTLVSENGVGRIDLEKDLLTLSNINDEYWQGGVGIEYNMLLIDYTPQAEKLLQANKRMLLKNGKTVTIKAYNRAANYINLEIVESLDQYKDAAQYPNPVKIVR